MEAPRSPSRLEGSWTSKEALLAQLTSLQRVIQLQDATACDNRSPADLSWRHEAVKLSVEKQAIQDECLEIVKRTNARYQQQCGVARSTIAGLIHTHSNACIKEVLHSTSVALERLWQRLSAVEAAHSRASDEIMYYQERTRDHVVKVETKLIDLAEEFDEAKRRLKVSQREAKALAKENDRLTKMVAQMHAAIVESRAMLESSERRATAAEGLVAKLAVDKSGGERQASDGVLRSVDEQKSNIPSRFDQTSGDSQMGVNNEIDSGHPSGTTDLEEPSGGSTIAKLICELRELESEARSLLASQELDVSELAAQQQQQQQHKVN